MPTDLVWKLLLLKTDGAAKQKEIQPKNAPVHAQE